MLGGGKQLLKVGRLLLKYKKLSMHMLEPDLKKIGISIYAKCRLGSH